MAQKRFAKLDDEQLFAPEQLYRSSMRWRW
jgi:hypothetical protein